MGRRWAKRGRAEPPAGPHGQAGPARHTAAAQRTDAVEAQGVQELGALQLGSQGRHVQGCVGQRRGLRVRPRSREQAVDEVQLGASEQVHERVLPGKQRSAGTERGEGAARGTPPVLPPPHDWAGEEPSSAPSKLKHTVGTTAWVREPQVQGSGAERDPSS